MVVFNLALLVWLVNTSPVNAQFIEDEENFIYETTDILEKITSSNHWERVHTKWSANIVNYVDSMDRFFSDDHVYEGGKDTRIRLSVGIRLKEGRDPDLIRKIKVRLSLPRTSDRLMLIFDDLVDSDDPAGPSDTFTDTSESHPNAGVRYILKKKERTELDADAGVRLGGTSQIYLRLRGTRQFTITDKLDFRWINTVTWYSSDGWVGKTEGQFNRKISDDLLFRSSTEVEIKEERSGVRPSQRFSLFKSYSHRRAVRYDIGGTWPETPDPEDTRYYTTVSFRRLLHSNWLYMEVEPGVEFTQEHDYAPRLSISVKFDIILGKVD